MTKNRYSLQQTGRKGDASVYSIVPCGIGYSMATDSLNSEYGQDSNTVFDDGGPNADVQNVPITVRGMEYRYVPWGLDDKLPYMLKGQLLSNMITAQCQSFNIISCYGQGLRFVDRMTRKDITDEDIRSFCLSNSLHEVFMEQATDMKFFFFSVTVIILNREGTKIVQIRNKDAVNCRMEYAPSTKSGEIEHVFYGDWRYGSRDEDNIEVIELLDYWNPLGDLRVRLGMERDPRTGEIRKATKVRKFAILSRMPTPGCQYYPIPYYSSIFRDAWLDIYRLIGIGKRYMIKNTSAPRVQIEVHNDYWDSV